jgi:hypothetical protein
MNQINYIFCSREEYVEKIEGMNKLGVIYGKYLEKSFPNKYINVEKHEALFGVYIFSVDRFSITTYIERAKLTCLKKLFLKCFEEKGMECCVCYEHFAIQSEMTHKKTGNYIINCGVCRAEVCIKCMDEIKKNNQGQGKCPICRSVILR